MIRLNVFIQAAEGNVAEMIEISKELVAATLNDEGCVAYDIFASATRADVLMICETWRDAEALSAHEATAHVTTLVPKLQSLGALKIEKFEF